ncbi:hybrid sensor histidine kinase/response regulator [Devosia salina]|uniref:histidine kinase n=1 Tax=Devosia salina TaxID=2860336 RepID=A0ABX8WET3_9HYPH|nr:PAS domain-containing sensor histidine kinase [Devosia salina]QYO75501.1 PAS domain-containing protein [Devosia salina]
MNRDTGGDPIPLPERPEAERLRRIAGCMARLGAWRVDLNSMRVHWSPETVDIHEEAQGFSPTFEQALNYYPPEQRPMISRTFALCAENGRSFDDIQQLVTAKDNRIWVRAIGQAVRDDTGTIVAVEGAFQDITHLVSMHNEADALARRLRQTLENISDAFFLLDREWRFSFLNPQAEALLGRRRGELEGCNIWGEFPQAIGSQFDTCYREAVQNGLAVRFQEYYPPLEAWFDVDAYPTPEGLAVYFRDISRRKRAEEHVRISNERFLLVAQATNDVIWDWDLVGNTLWWNENFKTLFGYDPDEVEPGPGSWMNRIHPEDADRVIESIHAVINGTEKTWVSEYRFLHSDGHALSIIDRGSVIRDESGKAVRMVGSMLDVSAQRELEGRLRQAQKLEAMGQLTGGVAHDFNNLLTVIAGSAELLCEALESGQESRHLAEMISTAAQRGADLTSRLLAFGRKQPLQPQLLDLGSLIAGMHTMLVRTLGEHIDVEVDQPEGLWPVEIDPALLESAVLNLAINARDAMSDGGRLTISMANTTFDTSQAIAADVAPGQYVVLAVSDTGHGIEPELLSKVFEPFFTTKDVGKGSGLGLSMVYGFVKQSGGHLRLRSDVGHGTSVSLYFSRANQSVGKCPENPARQVPEGGNELILVVEDDALVRRHVCGLLGGLGYRVLEATAATPAMELLAANPDVTLLFTDIVMPGGMNGVDLAKRARVLRPDLKVLFTSGYAENAVETDGRLDPGIDLLSKPYSRDHLAASLRKILQ